MLSFAQLQNAIIIIVGYRGHYWGYNFTSLEMVRVLGILRQLCIRIELIPRFLLDHFQREKAMLSHFKYLMMSNDRLLLIVSLIGNLNFAIFISDHASLLLPFFLD